MRQETLKEQLAHARSKGEETVGRNIQVTDCIMTVCVVCLCVCGRGMLSGAWLTPSSCLSITACLALAQSCISPALFPHFTWPTFGQLVKCVLHPKWNRSVFFCWKLNLAQGFKYLQCSNLHGNINLFWAEIQKMNFSLTVYANYTTHICCIAVKSVIRFLGLFWWYETVLKELKEFAFKGCQSSCLSNHCPVKMKTKNRKKKCMGLFKTLILHRE